MVRTGYVYYSPGMAGKDQPKRRAAPLPPVHNREPTYSIPTPPLQKRQFGSQSPSLGSLKSPPESPRLPPRSANAMLALGATLPERKPNANPNDLEIDNLLEDLEQMGTLPKVPAPSPADKREARSSGK